MHGNIHSLMYYLYGSSLRNKGPQNLDWVIGAEAIANFSSSQRGESVLTLNLSSRILHSLFTLSLMHRRNLSILVNQPRFTKSWSARSMYPSCGV